MYYGKFNENVLVKGDENNGKKLNIVDFISKIGNNTEKDIKIIKDIIYKLINKITKSYNKNYISLDISAVLPNNDYNISRWHYDGFEKQTKFITLLKGPAALFIDNKDIKSKNTFFEIDNKMWIEQKKFSEKNGIKINKLIKINDKYRKILANKLKNAKIIQPNNNQGIIYITDIPNDNKMVGIHSEPINNEKRFFISVICGDKNEIDKIK